MERNRTVVEQLRASTAENAIQQSGVARKIAEAEVLRLKGVSQTNAAEGAWSSSSMHVPLTRADGLASSVLDAVDYLAWDFWW